MSTITASSTVATSSKSISDAVLDYMTSLKSVRKRDGSEQPFSYEKLSASLAKAMHEVGVRDAYWVSRVLEQVMSRLVRTFDGHTVPTTNDIREVITATLIDNNFSHVVKKYTSFRLDRRVDDRQPVYGNGITVKRYFTTVDRHPYELLKWEKRTAKITNEKGGVVFEQNDVEVPSFWSQTATNIVVQKYFCGRVGSPDRETSVRQLVDRVAKTMADWGRKDGYFQTAEDAMVFEHELTHILINQMAAFNSPVWFNVGVAQRPQCSACFINSVQDDMRSILHLCVTEGMIFKNGSGSGINLSNLRSSHEFMGGSNGRASGPISFMKGLDSFAGVIKSGGKTRRAAKMVILNVDHPDIESFITCKAEEEKKAWALMDVGYDGSIDGPAYASIYFQNANNSVRVTDEFIKAVENDEEWITREVTTGKPSLKYKARQLMNKIAEATWQCGDPGLQYDTTINKWHTCKNTGRINASNPCAEFMFLDDSACNLASMNLMRFRKIGTDGLMQFDVEAFAMASRVMITAMEISVSNSSYPTPAIEQNSHDYRPLGIGYANLGALMMSRGLAYDSDEARNFAAAITSLLSSESYDQSALIAEKIGSFVGYKRNAGILMDVMRMHRDAAYTLGSNGVPTDLMEAQKRAWDRMVQNGDQFGVRNSQISVIAPTGTIAFFMDCDTTGIEPDIALVKYKWLVGGGMVKMVNQTVPEALARLGYTDEQKKEMLAHIDKMDTIEGAPHLKAEHLPVFDCAFKAKNGNRSIHYMAHVKMMASVQPFVSGAISKTVNMPQESTVEEISNVYMEGARLGLKAIAIYRDGSKRQQPLTTSLEKDQKTKTPVVKEDMKLRRRRLPDERRSITHKFNIGSHEGYITVGLYDDGKPGEMFLTMAKEGSVLSGMLDSFATTVSIALQYGVPLNVLVNKFAHMRFEPSGFTSHPNIRMAKSIVDYIFRWMALKFLSQDEQRTVGVNFEPTEQIMVTKEDTSQLPSQANIFAEPLLTPDSSDSRLLRSSDSLTLTSTFDNQADAPACDTCGSIMVRNASCYKCLNCGGTSGCS
ncbi:MAG: vitamin B12-dependent ribonucleotide reductase [Patescibacteria group bacterium]